jgi:molybdopterin biosynthesis enzyme
VTFCRDERKWPSETLELKHNFGAMIGDGRGSFAELVSDELRRENIDIFVSAGAISMSRFDFVQADLDQPEGEARFHRVNVCPSPGVELYPIRCHCTQRDFRPR